MTHRIRKDRHETEGLYLYAEGGVFFDLSRVRIQRLAEAYWNDPAKLSPSVRQDDAFQACDVCPFKGHNALCSAMKPLLPFLEEMDRFHSYDKVTAVYVPKRGLEYVADTTMQTALQYVTNMGIFEYCEGAKRYHQYFYGIDPFLNMNENLARLFLNVYWLKRGNQNQIDELIGEMQAVIKVISGNSIKRLAVMCKSDVFINAYIKTYYFVEMLTVVNIDATLGKHFHRQDS